MWPAREVRSSGDCALCRVKFWLSLWGGRRSAYLAIILPGNATLTVHSLPFVGWKTAVGLEVSTAAGAVEVVPLGIVFASDRRFRFYIKYP
jgi:hypothetical protein